jgi:hypothetical protein
MALDIHRRLARLETKKHVGKPRIELWINDGHGLLHNPSGQVLTREAFDAAFPNARKFTLNIFGNSDRD